MSQIVGFVGMMALNDLMFARDGGDDLAAVFSLRIPALDVIYMLVTIWKR
jgi:hypothetical protein